MDDKFKWIGADFEYEYGNDPSLFRIKPQESLAGWQAVGSTLRNDAVGTIFPATSAAYRMPSTASLGERCYAYGKAGMELAPIMPVALKGLYRSNLKNRFWAISKLLKIRFFRLFRYTNGCYRRGLNGVVKSLGYCVCLTFFNLGVCIFCLGLFLDLSLAAETGKITLWLYIISLRMYEKKKQQEYCL